MQRVLHYGLFGGKRAYAAGLARRAATGDSSDKMFTSISVPFVKGLAVK